MGGFLVEDNITGNNAGANKNYIIIFAGTRGYNNIVTLQVRSTGNNHNFNTFISIKPVKTVMHYTKALNSVSS